jgi:hypothetical protein
MVDEVDLGALEAVFNDAIAHLRQVAISLEIKRLSDRAKGGLSLEDRQRLTELLAQKRSAGPSAGGGAV